MLLGDVYCANVLPSCPCADSKLSFTTTCDLTVQDGQHCPCPPEDVWCDGYGHVDFFASHAWKNNFGELINTIKHYVENADTTKGSHAGVYGVEGAKQIYVWVGTYPSCHTAGPALVRVASPVLQGRDDASSEGSNIPCTESCGHSPTGVACACLLRADQTPPVCMQMSLLCASTSRTLPSTLTPTSRV